MRVVIYMDNILHQSHVCCVLRVIAFHQSNALAVALVMICHCIAVCCTHISAAVW